MREILSEILKQSAGLFDEVKITGTDEEILVQATDGTNILHLKAILNPSPEFNGQFGITNLAMLNGLLEFASYKTENSKFVVKRDNKPKIGETVVSFQFFDQNGAGAKYATKNPELMKMATIKHIPWEVEVVPTKAKITEFTQLVNLYRGINETTFGVKIENKNLILTIGEDHATTHNASMVFANDVSGSFSSQSMKYSSAMFLNMIKVATMNDVIPSVGITGQGPLGVSATTKNGVYSYILRTADSKKK